MPSSIETPPKTSTEEKSITSVTSDSSKLIDSEKISKEEYEDILKEYKQKLNEVENAAKSLRKMLLEMLPQLRNSTEELKTEQIEMTNSFNLDMVKLKETCVSVITHFCANLEKCNQEVIGKLQTEKDENEMILKDEVEAEQAKCAELQSEIEKAVRERKETEEDLKGKLDKARQEQNELIEKHDREIQELVQKHELEMEVEIDKLKADLSDKHIGLEKELEKSVLVVQNKETTIENLKKDRIKLEEALLEKFQIEKEEICDILAKEHEAKLFEAIKLQTEKTEKEKSILVEELKNLHESDTTKKLEELKQSLMLEKQQELTLTQSTLTLEHNKLTEELKNKTLEEKNEEMDELKSELELKFQADLARFSAEFNNEKENLVQELNKYKLKVFNVCSVQTDFSEANCDTQTGDSLSLEFLSHSSVQTDVIKLLDISNQTETLEQSCSTAQTDEPETVPTLVLSNISVQTETQDMAVELAHFSTQTDKVQIEQTCPQTVKSAESHSETQTQKETVDHSSVQTDISSQDQSSVQTEEIACDQSNLQSCSVNQGFDNVDGSEHNIATTAVQTEEGIAHNALQGHEKVKSKRTTN